MHTTRRLPVFLVVDCSADMAGVASRSVESLLEGMLMELRCDPMSLETVWLSLVVYGDGARQIVPLTELMEFAVPPRPHGGKPTLGAALGLVVECLRTQVVHATPLQKGDWKPLIVLISDSNPTDSWQTAAEKLLKSRARVFGAMLTPGAMPEAVRQIAQSAVIDPTQLSLGGLKNVLKFVSDSVPLTTGPAA